MKYESEYSIQSEKEICKHPKESKFWFLYTCLQGYTAKLTLLIFIRKSLAFFYKIPNDHSNIKGQLIQLFI